MYVAKATTRWEKPWSIIAVGLYLGMLARDIFSSVVFFFFESHGVSGRSLQEPTRMTKVLTPEIAMYVLVDRRTSL